jgi:putative transposase
MPERLRRLEQIFERSPIYFVTACTYERRAILSNESTHKAFRIFAEQGLEHGAAIGAYVIMPDHVHLFVALDGEKINLPRWTKGLKGVLSKEFRERAISSPYWQKGFFDHVLRSGESYSQKWDYVRDNPVRAGLVSHWQDWHYLGQVFDLEYRSYRG